MSNPAGDQLAVVGFHQRTFWLTPFTSDLKQIDSAIDRLRRGARAAPANPPGEPVYAGAYRRPAGPPP